jgi:hypothetical protein
MSYVLAIAAIAQQVFAGGSAAKDILHQNELQREIDALNAEYKETEAFEAETLGYTQSARYQSIVDVTIGSQRSAFAGEGVDVNSGTAKAVQAEARLTGQLNIIDMHRNARARATGLKLEASNIRLGSAFSRVQANSDANAARMRGLLGATEIGLNEYDRHFGGPQSKVDTKSNVDSDLDDIFREDSKKIGFNVF